MHIMSKKKSTNTITNRQVRRDYKLIDSYVAGIALYGHEVKSLRLGNGDLRGSYVNFSKGELFLLNAYIAPYPHAKLDESYDPNRSRKLLLSKNELKKLAAAKQNKLAIVPTKLFIHGQYIKCEIATAKGLKKHDKRETLKRKQHDREAKAQ